MSARPVDAIQMMSEVAVVRFLGLRTEEPVVDVPCRHLRHGL